MTDFSSIKRPHKSYLPYVIKVCTFFATYLKLLLEKTSNAGLVYSRTSCNIRCKHGIIHVVESELRFFACVPSGALFICVCSEKSKIKTNGHIQVATLGVVVRENFMLQQLLMNVCVVIFIIDGN